MTSCVSEVEEPTFRQDDHGVTVVEDPGVDLRLDVDALDAGVLARPAMSISLSKCPMFPTIA